EVHLPVARHQRRAVRGHVGSFWSGLENGDAGQFLALEVLEAGTAPGGDVAERGLVEPELPHGRGGVATAHDGEARNLRERLGDGTSALGEGGDLERAHRAVPEHRLRPLQRAREGRGGVGPDVEAQAVGRDLVGGYDARLRLTVAGRE